MSVEAAREKVEQREAQKPHDSAREAQREFIDAEDEA